MWPSTKFSRNHCSISKFHSVHLYLIRITIPETPFYSWISLSIVFRHHVDSHFPTILDDVVYNGHPTTAEHLEYEYLAVSLTFDGELEFLAEKLAEFGGEEFKSIFSHCYGYAKVELNAGSILKFLETGQVTTSFLYVEADGDLQETLRALLAQKLITEMLAKAQFLNTADKRALVLETADKIRSANLPLAGDFIEERN